jgi:hypothetical protein
VAQNSKTTTEPWVSASGTTPPPNNFTSMSGSRLCHGGAVNVLCGVSAAVSEIPTDHRGRPSASYTETLASPADEAGTVANDEATASRAKEEKQDLKQFIKSTVYGQ